MAKIITVFGATGHQGGAVVKALLDDKEFKVRGITRNVGRDKAKALQKKGVEMVEADLADVASLEKAMAGSYGVFAVTNYIAYMDKEKELQMGMNIVNAASKVGVTHLVYSGLEDVSALLGKKCAHFDGKAQVEKHLLNSTTDIQFRSGVRFAAYMENVLDVMRLTKVGDGMFSLNIPMEGKPMHTVCAGSSGRAILTIFKNPEKYNGRVIGLSGDRKTVQEYCDIINKYIDPVKVIAGKMTAKKIAQIGSPMATDLSAMYEFYQSDHTTYNIADTKELDPKTKNFEAYIRGNIGKIAAMFK